MTITSAQAFQRGMRKGLDIVSHPDPKRLRTKRRELATRSLVGEAWKDTGVPLSKAMRDFRQMM